VNIYFFKGEGGVENIPGQCNNLNWVWYIPAFIDPQDSVAELTDNEEIQCSERRDNMARQDTRGIEEERLRERERERQTDRKTEKQSLFCHRNSSKNRALAGYQRGHKKPACGSLAQCFIHTFAALQYAH